MKSLNNVSPGSRSSDPIGNLAGDVANLSNKASHIRNRSFRFIPQFDGGSMYPHILVPDLHVTYVQSPAAS